MYPIQRPFGSRFLPLGWTLFWWYQPPMNTKIFSAVLLSLPLVALIGCSSAPPPCGARVVLETSEGAQLRFDPCEGQLSLGTEADPERWLVAKTDGRAPLAFAEDDVTVTMRQGRYLFEGVFGTWSGSRQGEIGEDDTWTSEDESTTLRWWEGEAGSIHLLLERSEDASRSSIAFGCKDNERFFGTGARSQGTEHRGTVPWFYAAEQGIGQVDYPIYELDLLRGRIGDTYLPVPWVVTDRGLGVGIVGEPQIGRAYLCADAEPDTLRFESWDRHIELQLFPGASARETVSEWTLASGPPVAAPDWAYGPWVAIQHGRDELMRTAEALRSQQIPATALWAQDWIGGDSAPLGGYDLNYHWQWDEDLYPGLPDDIATLHQQGFAFMGYFNPFITEPFDEMTEARAQGYLPKTPEGEHYEFTIVDRFGSVIDMTHPEGVAWMQDYMRVAAEMGQDGWMCDFAEWMPFDAVLYEGSGQDNHNAYPLLWQEANMQVLNEVHGEGNALCFNRSGWSGTQAIAPVTWGGDQETSFARDDGMPTAREIGVGLGLSGIGRYGSDIAGFSSVWGSPATREVYWRWIEMAAFEPVMRTHDGLAADENWHWEEDEETVAHFARYARWHMRLLPYLRVLDREFMQQGLPFMRHNLLVVSETDSLYEQLLSAPDQHFLGDDLLVAPVLEAGAEARSVVLPEGRWHSLLSTASYEGGQSLNIASPLGETVVLARGGSLLPLGDPEVQTSYVTDDASVVDHRDRDDRLHLMAFAGGSSALDLAEGGSLQLDATGKALGTVTLDGVALDAACADETDSNCIESAETEHVTLRVSWAAGTSTLAGDGWSLAADLPDARSGRVELRGFATP